MVSSRESSNEVIQHQLITPGGCGCCLLRYLLQLMHVSAGGALIGFACAIATRLILKWMHRRGHKAPEQLALTVAMAYLAFYIANGPCE